MADDLRPWREQALDSLLLKAVAHWTNNSDSWLESALPRLRETIRINPLRREFNWVENQIIRMGAKEIEWCPNGWIMPWIRGNIPPEHRKLFIALHETGRITRQEAVSMIPSLLLDIQENQIILDMCASPGSKSTHIAEILQGTGVVIANDVSKKRTNTLVANAQRISLPNIMIIQHDGRHIPKIPGSGYDAILVDAPCTGSATTRKNPDVWNKWKPSAGKRLHTLQIDLLSRAIKIARSGSVIVYSTCSLDPIENEAVISRILENEEGVELEKIDVETLNGLTYRNGMVNWTVLDDEINPIEDERFEPSKNLEIRKNLQNCIRIHQDESGHGGFFVAKIRINKQIETPTNDNCRRIPPNPNRKGVYPTPINIDELPLISEMYAPGIENSSLWTKGKRILWSNSCIMDKIWSQETKSRPDRIHEGSQWPPLNLIHLGVRGWEKRDSRNYRLSSEGLHSIEINEAGSRIHIVTNETVTRIIEKDGPSENVENFISGSNLLLLERHGIVWRIPIWAGERISRMWKQQEDIILRKMMEENT